MSKCSNAIPSLNTIPNAKYVDNPTPGANPNGRLPKIPHIKDPTQEDNAVAITISVEGIPNFIRIFGFNNNT